MTRLSYTRDYDAFGNPLTASRWRVRAAGGNLDDAVPGATYLATVGNTDGRPLRRPSTSTIAPPAWRSTRSSTRRFPPGQAGRTVADVLDARARSRQLGRLESFDFYDGDPPAGQGEFVGLPFGTVGRYGAVTRAETLALTDAIVHAAYGAHRPRTSARTALRGQRSYPAEFVQQLAPLAGYVFHAAGGPYAGGYYVTTPTAGASTFTAPGTVRGLVLASRDPLGAETTIEYDQPYTCFRSRSPNAALSACALVQLSPDAAARRSPMPTTIGPLDVHTDWASWCTAVAAGQAGPRATAISHGRAHARVRLLAFGAQPAESVRTIAPGASRRPTPRFRSGRRTRPSSRASTPTGSAASLQTRTQGGARAVRRRDLRRRRCGAAGQQVPAQAAPSQGVQTASYADPNVIVSGWQRYDNKGRVVEKYEPFFVHRLGLRAAARERRSRRSGFGAVTMFYDPRGQRHPHREPGRLRAASLFGVPAISTIPSDPEQSPDAVGGLHLRRQRQRRPHASRHASASYRHHWNTPASIVVDALGRTIVATVRNRAKANERAAACQRSTSTTHVPRTTFKATFCS